MLSGLKQEKTPTWFGDCQVASCEKGLLVNSG